MRYCSASYTTLNVKSTDRLKNTLLDQYVIAFDLAIKSIAEKAMAITEDANVISAIINPDSQNSSTKAEILSKIRNMMNTNPSVKNVYLCIRTNDTIYPAVGGVGSFEGSKLMELLNQYYESEKITFNYGTLYEKTGLKVIDGTSISYAIF